MSEEKKTLYAQARHLGLEVDGRWSVETLAEKVQEAIENHAEAQDRAVHEASDTWVYAVRDCFLGTEKKRAGSVFMAPKELHLNWRATGASRLAEEDEIAEALANA
ncbi:MAG: hypothetical protein ACTHJQ_22675 [Rhizobiaceae bacterium]